MLIHALHMYPVCCSPVTFVAADEDTKIIFFSFLLVDAITSLMHMGATADTLNSSSMS